MAPAFATMARINWMTPGHCTNSPVEILEIEQKYFRVTRYELRCDSGGAGRHRGGLGAYREYEILEDNVNMTVYSDRFRYPAKGVAGRHGRFHCLY